MEHIQKTIDDALGKLAELEREVTETKELVNRLRGFIRQPPMFEISQPGVAGSGLKGDEYVGTILQTAIRNVLERRKALGQSPCTVEEIHADLKAGGFRFETRDDANARKGVYNNLTRGSGSVFIRLSNDKWGLLTWYPGVKRKKAPEPVEAGPFGEPFEPQEPQEPQEPSDGPEEPE